MIRYKEWETNLIRNCGSKNEQQGARIAILENKGLGVWLGKHKKLNVKDLLTEKFGFNNVNSILEEFEKS